MRDRPPSTSRTMRHAALADANLQDSLAKLNVGFFERRARRSSACPSSRRCAIARRDIKNHALANLDFYLEEFERKVRRCGGHVHWAPTPTRRAPHHRRSVPARRRPHGRPRARSMIGEEIALNDHLEADGHHAGRDRSRRIHHPAAPRAAQPHHRAGGPSHQGPGRPTPSARRITRSRSQAPADRARRHAGRGRASAAPEVSSTPMSASPAPISWSPRPARSIIVTNEGNGDLTQTLPRVHIVLASIEKVVPTLEDAADDPARAGALGHGPGNVGLHDLLDRPAPAGRSRRARANIMSCCSTTAARRCSAPSSRTCCAASAAAPASNHCPVYQAVGGHAYGWVYPGPIGAVLTPALIGIEKAGASAQCLDLLRALRERLPDAHPAAQDAAALARARVRAPSDALALSRTAWRSGAFSPAVRALSPGLRPRRPLRSARSAAGAAPSAPCRSRGAGPPIATCRRRRGPASNSSGPSAGDEPRRRSWAISAAPCIARRRPRRHRWRRGSASRRRVRSRRAVNCRSPERIELFLAMAKRASASVARVADAAAVPAAVAEFLPGRICRRA